MFVGARRLQNGGVLLDCKDTAMASWVKETVNMRQLLAAMGGNCVYRPRRVEAAAEMIPVETRIANTETWWAVEWQSGLAEGAIVGMRWIKVEDRRSPMQRVAHVKVDFTSAEAANRAIDNHLFFGPKSVRVRKSEEEACRCAKCQKYDGHIARECPLQTDVCGRCAGTHCTSACMVEGTAAFCCSNCAVDGHRAVSRECPLFQTEQQQRRARDPTAGYRYFPTTDLKTWAATGMPTQPQERERGGWQEIRDEAGWRGA
ncbi:hypothetical protein FB451DRAFT_1056536 [Mycena latifolia]|nr:hypothetical protein FB451DRAFT_1056536 [Mycena latifolia]